MSYRSYTGWKKYWNTEPWGPYRDNMHIGILAREIRRMAPGSKVPKLEVFMIRPPIERALEMSGKIMASLGTLASPATPEARRKLRKARLARKKARRVKGTKK
jgi:hypothetical protein